MISVHMRSLSLICFDTKKKNEKCLLFGTVQDDYSGSNKETASFSAHFTLQSAKYDNDGTEGRMNQNESAGVRVK